jgi:hypothetical protein
MHSFRIVTSALVATLTLGGVASTSHANTPVLCAPEIDSLVRDTRNVEGLHLKGVRLTARGSDGFTSFVKTDGFQIETTPLHTPAGGKRDVALVDRSGSSAFTGTFHEVFPGRGNGDEERTSVWIGRGGFVWLRSETYNGDWSALLAPVCYRGPGGQLVVTGHVDNPGFGTDFWQFLLIPLFPLG